MATSSIKRSVNMGGALDNISLNDLPAAFCSYGAWGGNNVTDVPFDITGCAVLTLPGPGASPQWQIVLSDSAIAIRKMNASNQWTAWKSVSLS